MTTMIVCSCRTVTDRTIAAALASGAECVHSVAASCGAGARCGGCWPELERLIAEHTAAHASQNVTQAA